MDEIQQSEANHWVSVTNETDSNHLVCATITEEIEETDSETSIFHQQGYEISPGAVAVVVEIPDPGRYEIVIRMNDLEEKQQFERREVFSDAASQVAVFKITDSSTIESYVGGDG